MGKRRFEAPKRLVRLQLPPSERVLGVGRETGSLCLNQHPTPDTQHLLPTRPVSSARLERQSYKLDVEGSIPSPAISSGRGSSRARAWARVTVEREADYRRPAPSKLDTAM